MQSEIGSLVAAHDYESFGIGGTYLHCPNDTETGQAFAHQPSIATRDKR